MHNRVRFIERVKADIKIGLERRKTTFANLTLLLLPALAWYMMCSGEDDRQLCQWIQAFCLPQRGRLDCYYFGDVKNLEMDSSQVLSFLLLPFLYNNCFLSLPLAEVTAYCLLNIDPLSLILPTEPQLHSFIHPSLKAMCNRGGRMYPQPQQVTTA